MCRERTIALAQVAAAERAKVVYVYDFGDDWRARRRGGEDTGSGRAGGGLPALHRRAAGGAAGGLRRDMGLQRVPG